MSECSKNICWMSKRASEWMDIFILSSEASFSVSEGASKKQLSQQSASVIVSLGLMIRTCWLHPKKAGLSLHDTPLSPYLFVLFPVMLLISPLLIRALADLVWLYRSPPLPVVISPSWNCPLTYPSVTHKSHREHKVKMVGPRKNFRSHLSLLLWGGPLHFLFLLPV